MPVPTDFDPYRGDIRDCCCELCRECAYAASRAGGDTRPPAVALLAALRAGTHVRVELAERIANLKAEHSVRVAEACSAGRSELHMLGLHRGYHGGSNARHYYGEPYSEEMMIGTGIGLTPGRYARAAAEMDARRAAFRVRRERQVVELIAADDRNRCTYFRVSGKLCAYHEIDVDAILLGLMAELV